MRITSLELTDAAAVRAPSRPAPPGLTVARSHAPELNRLLYATIGQDFHWTDRLPWTAEQWRRHEASVQTQVATLGGQTAGYYELRERDGSVEVVIFGLLEHARGLGIGGGSRRGSGCTPARTTAPTRWRTTGRAGCRSSTCAPRRPPRATDPWIHHR